MNYREIEKESEFLLCYYVMSACTQNDGCMSVCVCEYACVRATMKMFTKPF